MFVQLDTGVDDGTPQCVHEACRLHSRALREVDAAAEDRRPDSLGDTVRVESYRLLACSHFGCSGNGSVDRIVLGRRSRHHQHSGLTQPDVLPARLAERTHGRHDSLPGARELQRTFASE